MENKNAIVILNNVGFNKIIFVEDFSDDNVKKGLSESFKVDAENLECISVGGHMVYGVKEKYPSLEGKLGSTSPYFAQYPPQHCHYILLTTAIL